MIRNPLALLSILLLSVAAASPSLAVEKIERRWIYMQLNLQVKENVAKAEGIMRRGKTAGYNGVVLADYKLNILDRVPAHYFDNARQFLKIAEETGMEVIPAVASIGYSDGLLAHDPNLAEGIPVKDAPFVVKGGVAELASELKDPLPGGTFEEHKNNVVRGWDFQDAAGEGSFVDTAEKHGGNSSLRLETSGKRGDQNYRVSRKIAVTPWRQYHASVWIKTKGYEAASNVRLFAMVDGEHILSHSHLGVKRDENWTQHHMIFNSLDNKDVRLYCGTWGGRGGVLWMDDLQLEETAFVNLLRRDGCPLVVSDEQGKPFEEGKDFVALNDPKLGNVPYAGNFELWHQPPQLKITPQSRIKDGQKLRVSFSHTVLVHDNQVTCCLAHSGVFKIVEDQVRKVEETFKPKTYFLSHDEIRVANWCASCRKEGQTAGQLLAENVRQCAAAIGRVNKSARLCIWSDMFDPFHNAHDNFYLVNGNLAGSWEGLPKEMIVINWNHGKAAKSLPFFGDRGHSQVLAGYYDSNPKNIEAWLKTGESTKGVTGAMYTTWTNNFSQLEAFAKSAWGER